jgi:hypothetical protein
MLENKIDVPANQFPYSWEKTFHHDYLRLELIPEVRGDQVLMQTFDGHCIQAEWALEPSSSENAVAYTVDFMEAFNEVFKETGTTDVDELVAKAAFQLPVVDSLSEDDIIRNPRSDPIRVCWECGESLDPYGDVTYSEAIHRHIGHCESMIRGTHTEAHNQQKFIRLITRSYGPLSQEAEQWVNEVKSEVDSGDFTLVEVADRDVYLSDVVEIPDFL